MQAVKYAKEVKPIFNRGKYNHLNSLDTIHSALRKEQAVRLEHHVCLAHQVRRRTPGGLRTAYMNPAQFDETLLILYEEKLLFILGVAVVRPSALLGDENMGDGKLVPHLSK